MTTIYTKTNAIRLIINDSDDSQTYQELSGEEYVTLSIKIDHYIPFAVGDYITVFGNVYSLKKTPAPVDKNSTIEFIYTLKFESLRADLGDVNFQLFDNTTIEVVPAYNPSTSYQIGNVCAYRDLYWECISPVTNIAPSENDYWALKSTVTNYVQPYNAATTYTYGNVVQYDYNYFKHIGGVDTVGVTPVEGDNWTIIRTAPQWDFSTTLTPQRYAQLIVDNMRRARPKQNWVVGYCMPASPKVLSFSCVKCLDSLGTISEAFETEFWIDGYSINIGKRAHNTGLTFKYGENNGLENITRGELSENKKVTRLIALGGTQNLLGTYRNGSNRLMLPNKYYLDADNIDLDTPLEDTQIWEDIFPSMSHATDDWDATKTYHIGDQVVYDGNSWDALQISTNVQPTLGAYWQLSEGTVTTFTSQYKFIDANLTFNPLDSQYIMADETRPKVRFITGNLAGYDFPIASFDISTKTITIEQIQEGTDSYLPTGAYTFKQGDQYVLIDLYMPQTYVAKAEQRLLAKAQDYITKYSVDQVTYSGNIDVIWATNNAINLNVGDVIHMQDDDYGINTDYRITVCKRGIANPYKYEITLSSAPYVPSKILSIINKTEQNETYIDMNDLKNINTKAEKLSKTPSLPLYKGDWSPDGIYIGSNIVYNIVKYNDKYYRTKTSVGAFSKETPPDQDDIRWTVFQGTYETLATGLLLAEVAYIDNLIVSKLATSANPYQMRLSNVGSSLGLFAKQADESSIDNSLIAMGKDISIMQTSGERKPAIKVRDAQWKGNYSPTTVYYKDDRVYYASSNGTYRFIKDWGDSETPTAGFLPTNNSYWRIIGNGNLGGGRYSELGSEGMFCNGSNINGFAVFTGITGNASGVFLLQKRNSDDGGVSASIIGLDQTNSSDGTSKSYGGYFNRLYVAGLYNRIRIVSASTTLLNSDCTIHCYNTSAITLTLPTPDNAMVGMKIKVRKLGTDDVAIYAHPSGKIWHSSEETYFTIANNDSCEFEWDGNYWVTTHVK